MSVVQPLIFCKSAAVVDSSAEKQKLAIGRLTLAGSV